MARIVPLNVGKVGKDTIFSMDGIPFIAPVKARRPLVKRWWKGYWERAKIKSTRSIIGIYVFHYHLRLLFPKEKGILSAYGSSLVGIAKDEYYTSRKYRALCNQVRKRDQTCVLCHSRFKLQVHHRSYDYWGNEDPLELVTLCRDCHKMFHDHSSVSLSGKNVLFVWTKPAGQNRGLPMGITTDLDTARKEREKVWKK